MPAWRSLLPDPLALPGGAVCATSADWEARGKPALRGQFASLVYGCGGPDCTVSIRIVERRAAAMPGGERIEIAVAPAAAIEPFVVALYRPKGAACPPVFFGPNFAGNASIDPDPDIWPDLGWMRDEPGWGIAGHRQTPATRGIHARRWPLAEILSRGYAVASWYDGDVCPDDPALCAARVQALGIEAGAVAVWAWGFARVREALALSGLVDATRTIAIGHSRHGKAALWAAACDPAIAAVVANNSGCGGARPFRVAGGETICDLFERFPHWFAPRLRDFAGREGTLPVDQHMAIALAAPRPAYVASAGDDAWANPAGEYLGVCGAAPAYALYGLDAAPGPFPARGESAGRGALGYHLRDGGHDLLAWDWRRFLDFADRTVAPR